ncbi:MAG TPA: hypothetical protein EYP54_11480 [Anaerolineales bacterium]|nr:hypothetical protein [Anaerolineales bacterium]
MAARKVLSTTEAARIQAGAPYAPAHDAYYIPPPGRKMDLKGYGRVKGFKTVARNTGRPAGWT